MQWSEVLENKSLQDLPFKIETNCQGQIIMTPLDNKHSRLQGLVIGNLGSLTQGSGTLISECPIETADGVKVADVGWTSQRFSQVDGIEPTFVTAPDLCVEILTISIHPDLHYIKKELYFQQGAQEVWICDLSGNVNFFDVNGELECSRLFPEFPKHVL